LKQELVRLQARETPGSSWGFSFKGPKHKVEVQVEVKKRGSSPNELAMIEGFKESRVRGSKGKLLQPKC